MLRRDWRGGVRAGGYGQAREAPVNRRGRRRQLHPQERALWAEVTRHVKPLRASDPDAVEPSPSAPSSPADSAPPEPEPSPPAARPARPPAPLPVPQPPLAALEPRTRRKLTRGAEVDARLDLHGLTQQAAHRRLRGFLLEAQAAGHTLVLVITGKGDFARLGDLRPQGFHEGRGVLKRAVPLWLAEPDLRAVVVGFEDAGRRHGGEGALYVRIRRRRAGP